MRASERRQFDRFREVTHLLPEGTHADSPDFLVEKDGRRIGVELTTVYASPSSFATHGRSGAEAAQKRAMTDHELWSRVIDLAARGSQGTPAESVNVSVFRGQPVHRRRLPTLAVELVDVVVKHLPVSAPVHLPSWADGARILPPEVDELSIWGTGFGILPRWQLTEMSLVYPVTRQYIQQCVDRKSPEQILGYRYVCDEVWLILVAEGRSTASMVTLSPDAMTAIYISAADRMFLLNEAGGICVELRRGEAS